MEQLKTTSRIHPLMAGAAVAVIAVCAAGTAAIMGVLPTSQAVTAPATAAAPLAATAPAPLAEAPAPVHRSAVAHRTAAHDEPVRMDAAPVRTEAAPVAQAKPNYVAMGAGAVLGGLVGNQVGGGRGRTLATVAGAVGGAMIGNEVAKSNSSPGSGK